MLERGFKRQRIYAIILDRVCVAHYFDVFETFYRAIQLELNVGGKPRRQPLHIPLDSTRAFRLEKELVTGFIGKAHYLVLYGRTVSRPHAVDKTRIFRTFG